MRSHRAVPWEIAPGHALGGRISDRKLQTSSTTKTAGARAEDPSTAMRNSPGRAWISVPGGGAGGLKCSDGVT